MERLNKYLAKCGLGSRRKCDDLIKRGEITVNDEKTAELGVKIDPQKDIVRYQNTIIKPNEKVYIALNKPKGYLCSVKRANPADKIVLDLIDIKNRLYPVGRLDKDSSGLLILTNDGEFANKLIHPKAKKEKEYEVRVNKPVTKDFLIRLHSPVVYEGARYNAKKAWKMSNKLFKIILEEGKKRQIRMMCKALNYLVLDIKRIRINKLKLGSLKEGEWRFISKKDVL